MSSSVKQNTKSQYYLCIKIYEKILIIYQNRLCLTIMVRLKLIGETTSFLHIFILMGGVMWCIACSSCTSMSVFTDVPWWLETPWFTETPHPSLRSCHSCLRACWWIPELNRKRNMEIPLLSRSNSVLYATLHSAITFHSRHIHT